MGLRSSDEVVIRGQRFPESDEATFVVATDILDGVSDDLEGLSDAGRRSTSSAEEDRRFGPIARVMEALERQMDHERSVAWLVSPSPGLAGARPLDLVSAGRGAEVLQYVRHLPGT